MDNNMAEKMETVDNAAPSIFEIDYKLMKGAQKDEFISVLLDLIKEKNEENTSLKDENAEISAKITALEEAKVAFEYQKADFENFKRRNLDAQKKAKEDGFIAAVEALIPSLDNFEHAIKIIEPDTVRNGVEMIYSNLQKQLASMGVVKMDAVGQEFDPDYHNAVMIAEAEKEEDVDKVVDVLQNGYTINGKVIRFAQVKVAK